MTFSQEKLADMHVKHLEMLQAIIHRLSNQGSSVKNYCFTSVAAIMGFAIAQKLPNLAFAAILAIVFFGALDANYLKSEKRFIALYNQECEVIGQPPSFLLDPRKVPYQSFLDALTSWSILLPYGGALFISVMTWVIISIGTG